MGKNRTNYKSLDKIASDSRVSEIWSEGEDGLWIQLTEGWNWDGCSCVHEYTVRNLIRAFKEIKEGDHY